MEWVHVISISDTVAPNFTTPLEDLSVYEGRPVTLICQVAGNPSPEVTWYLDEHVLPSGGEFKQEFDGQTAKLVLDEAFEDDEGEFRCVAKNLGGEAETKMVLTVEGLWLSISHEYALTSF